MKMPHIKALPVLTSALLLALTACSPGAKTPITLGEADAGRTVELSHGDTLVVALAGNITTGYNWEALPQDPALVQQVGEPQVTPDSTAVGAGGKIALTFRAVKSGRAGLTLVYRRAWEKDVPPLKTFSISVVVR